MDSATMAYFYKSKGYEVHMVGFNYGQRHSKELDCLYQIGEQLKAKVTIIDLTQIKSLIGTSSLTSDEITVPDGHYAEETMRITVVPNRNAMMLSIATAIGVAEGAEVVATGIHAGDHFIYPDCRPAFFNPLSEAFVNGNQGHAVENFRLEAPFITKTKAEIAKLGDDLGVPYELTWSCYKGGEMHCGRCGTCVERIEAFLDSMTTDPTVYADGIEYACSEIKRKKNVL